MGLLSLKNGKRIDKTSMIGVKLKSLMRVGTEVEKLKRILAGPSGEVSGAEEVGLSIGGYWIKCYNKR